MTKHVSEILGLQSVSHKDIDFVDIVMAPDTELFLDPCLIEFGKTEWTAKAQKTVMSYFDRLYDLYRGDGSNEEKLLLFEHTHEINATKLGYGNGYNGKAKTAFGMVNTLHSLSSLSQKDVGLSTASDLVVFIRNLAEDCLSDMLTNIILKELMEFTLEQCKKYGKETQETPEGYYYWSASKSQWEQYKGECLAVNGKPILLVPKGIVRNRYYFTANQFFSRIILTHIQDEESWVDAKGKSHKPSIKYLRKKYQGDDSALDCAISMTLEHPPYLQDYHRQLPSLYSGKGMSDEKLDKILY